MCIRDRGVVGIDLAGAEALYPTKDYVKLFSYAKTLEIPFTIHAGEAAGVESIKAALDIGAKRIGHGVKVIDDEALMERVIKENILLEVCVTSNYQTEAIKRRHPIEKLYRKGVKISINTDNDTVSGIDINREYARILQETKMDIEDLIKCNINSIPFIFADDKTKNKLLNMYEKIKK